MQVVQLNVMKIVNPTAVLGEDAACDYLRKKGYKILERNFRKGYGEIDIVALDGDILVFIEVKTRTSDSYGTPFDAISSSKLRLLIKGANFYKYILHPELPDTVRIDAVGVLAWGDEILSIEHIENISGF
jgi:putative endonuclease